MQIIHKMQTGTVGLAISDSGRLSYNYLNSGQMHDELTGRTIYRGKSLAWIGPGCCDYDRQPASSEILAEVKKFRAQIDAANEEAEKTMAARLEAKAQKEDAQLDNLVKHGLCPTCGTFCHGDCSF
jgi:hypothetical protein